MYIYKLINILNDKIYVGQTTKNIHIRFKSHMNRALDKTTNGRMLRGKSKKAENLKFIYKNGDS